MPNIVAKAQLSPNVTRLDVIAPRIAQIRQPGQFVIVHRAEGAERIPLTIADADARAGTIALVIQSVGKSTQELVALEPGEAIADIAGPLGHPTELIASGRALCIGGGVGTAVVHPIAQGLHRRGVGVLSIMSKNFGMVLSRNSFIGLGLGVDTSISATVTIDNNVFKGNGASGLNLRDVWAGTVTGNTFVGNGFSPGIYADPSGNPLTAGLWTSIDGNGTIAHNTAIGNAGYGIEAHGAVDGGGNIARGNGNPAQCLGVVCTKK